MKTGKVKFFNDKKGFGFIVQDSGEKDIFVGSRGCKDSIKEGDRVQYSTLEGEKGLIAVDVRIIKE